MIGKTSTVIGFKGTISYCLQKMKNAEILDMNNLAHTDKRGIIREFVSLSSTNENVSKPVWHSILSFAKEDNITNEKMAEIANRFMVKAGFTSENNQWVIIKHNDTIHNHCHIVGNRIGFDGKTVDDYYYKSKTVQWAKELEKEYNLTVVESLFKQKLIEKSEGVKYASPEKDFIKKCLKELLKNPSINTLNKASSNLKQHNIEIIIHNYQKTGKPYGVSFKLGDSVFKGSELGKQFAFKELSKSIQLAPSLAVTPPLPGLNVLKIAAKIIKTGMELGM